MLAKYNPAQWYLEIFDQMCFQEVERALQLFHFHLFQYVWRQEPWSDVSNLRELRILTYRLCKLNAASQCCRHDHCIRRGCIFWVYMRLFQQTDALKPAKILNYWNRKQEGRMFDQKLYRDLFEFFNNFRQFIFKTLKDMGSSYILRKATEFVVIQIVIPM